MEETMEMFELQDQIKTLLKTYVEKQEARGYWNIEELKELVENLNEHL